MLAKFLPDKAIIKPVMALFALTFISQFVGMFYSSFELAPPPRFTFLEWFAFIFVLCWLFESEMDRRKIHGPFDSGMFLYAAWFVVLPIYFVISRGLWGLFGVFAFVAVVFTAWLSVTIVLIVGWS